MDFTPYQEFAKEKFGFELLCVILYAPISLIESDFVLNSIPLVPTFIVHDGTDLSSFTVLLDLHSLPALSLA